MKHYEEKPKNELMVVSTNTEELTEYSLAAQMILEKSLNKFNVQRLMQKIDEALILGDKETFYELSKKYTQLLN
ncbi:IDEAL domain-containing protein [Bacillus pinisoli]|uniref:IDEAL domain-containing protein n=1 Tax=Bacillus pinisoli TaxID=2901866 RepID=UPI001FF3AEAF|nr:IDEAL domain-containing protein [Bacillus pinisoli]